ncbi:MAG: cytidine deaminase [Candidatus Melainabacteria bacterium GWF2_37_15]|nr:MAG: cytidine deaminase [Candidatus Melainabacteria bacterium GWF2_37_15]
MNKDPIHLLELASEAAKKAYAPYSKFRVGACALYEDGSVYTGCNVENVSYGLTICAERSAISAAVANGEHGGLVAIAIFSPDSELCFPCGACRQWIIEFSDNAKIIVQDKTGKPVEVSIKELLPNAEFMQNVRQVLQVNNNELHP